MEAGIKLPNPRLSPYEFMTRLRLRAKQVDVKAKFGFLFEGFEKHGICPYWEVTAITLRKVSVMLIAMGGRGWGIQLQTMAMIFLLVVAVMLHIKYEPYEAVNL
eukprot:g282.t1